MYSTPYAARVARKVTDCQHAYCEFQSLLERAHGEGRGRAYAYEQRVIIARRILSQVFYDYESGDRLIPSPDSDGGLSELAVEIAKSNMLYRSMFDGDIVIRVSIPAKHKHLPKIEKTIQENAIGSFYREWYGERVYIVPWFLLGSIYGSAYEMRLYSENDISDAYLAPSIYAFAEILRWNSNTSYDVMRKKTRAIRENNWPLTEGGCCLLPYHNKDSCASLTFSFHNGRTYQEHLICKR